MEDFSDSSPPAPVGDMRSIEIIDQLQNIKKPSFLPRSEDGTQPTTESPENMDEDDILVQKLEWLLEELKLKNKAERNIIVANDIACAYPKSKDIQTSHSDSEETCTQSPAASISQENTAERSRANSGRDEDDFGCRIEVEVHTDENAAPQTRPCKKWALRAAFTLGIGMAITGGVFFLQELLR